MAFINGYSTRYECPICHIGCRPKLNNNDFEYEHIDNVVFVNGYPCPCENNGKMLTKDEIETINSPNIVSNTTGYF